MLILGFPTMVSGQWKVNKTVDDKYTINTSTQPAQQLY